MANGISVMNTAEARAKASEMKTIAHDLESLLNDVSKKIEEIDNVDTGIYQGNNKPAELRAELDSFRQVFNLAYDQIIKSADDITLIANTMDQE